MLVEICLQRHKRIRLLEILVRRQFSPATLKASWRFNAYSEKKKNISKVFTNGNKKSSLQSSFIRFFEQFINKSDGQESVRIQATTTRQSCLSIQAEATEPTCESLSVIVIWSCGTTDCVLLPLRTVRPSLMAPTEPERGCAAATRAPLPADTTSCRN